MYNTLIIVSRIIVSTNLVQFL